MNMIYINKHVLKVIYNLIVPIYILLELVMNFFDMLLNDPVVIMSFLGLATVIGICSFYVYYFLKHISEDSQ